MLKTKKYILLCLLLFSALSVVAQRATVRVTVEPSDILIGEQAVVNIEVKSPIGRTIIFPAYMPGDTIVKGIEVLQMLDADTIMTEVMTLNQRYIITSFDSTLYHVPYMKVLDGVDTLKTNDFGLKVTSPQLSEQTLAYLDQLKNKQTDSISFEQLEISDIKDVMEPPFVWQDYLIYLLIPLCVLIALTLLGAGLYLFLNKKKKGYFFKPKVIEPPHVVALRGLTGLKEKKLSQKGMEKEYYTQLTDILRTYIEGRFNINAPEMISSDIVEAIRHVTDTGTPAQGLEQILNLADMVKFAKYMALPNENDLSMANAYIFVSQTKIEEAPIPVNGQQQAAKDASTKSQQAGKPKKAIVKKVDDNKSNTNTTNRKTN